MVRVASRLVSPTKLTIVSFSWMRWKISAEMKKPIKGSKRGLHESSRVKMLESIKLMMIKSLKRYRSWLMAQYLILTANMLPKDSDSKPRSRELVMKTKKTAS